MLVSTIIATICRESLDRSVESVLSQPLDVEQFEVIVVNDSGGELTHKSWQDAPNVKIINTYHRERSVARNAGAAIARGKYLHILDDDDWLLPDGFLTLVKLTEEFTAEVLVGGSVLVDREGRFIRNFYPDFNQNAIIYTMAGEWIPLQACFIKSDTFLSIGGFNQQICATEDLDLIRRLAFNSSFQGSPELVVNLSMGVDGSTTRWDSHAEERMKTREFILDQDEVWKKIHQSVYLTPEHRGYWYGKLTRIFFTSVLWNIQQRRILDAISRFVFGVAGLLSAGANILSGQFWHGLLRPHISFSFKVEGQKRTEFRN